MIFNKEVAFPYPILMNETENYIDEDFSLDVEIKENSLEYILDFKFLISSNYLKNLLNENRVKAILIIQNLDSKFYYLDSLVENEEQYEGNLSILKSRMTLDKKTRIQVILQANEELNFTKNDDLVEFYNEIKSEIYIEKYSVVGISNEVVFDGSQKSPTKLFERKLDETLDSDIAFELTEECILIKYRSTRFQFQKLTHSNILNYPYIYIGLQKALLKFLIDMNRELSQDFDEIVELNSILEEEISPLNRKLLKLMKNKGIREFKFDDIDKVIEKISDKIIENYTQIIERLSENGN